MMGTARPAVESDLVVSLGTNCEIAFNLRHFYGIERTGLLDWVITPLSSLPDLIRSRFALVDDGFSDSLLRVERPGNDSVLHAPTGILLHHAFTRDENDRISPDWRSEINDVANKFRFLGDRMNLWLSEAKSPALFINREGLHNFADQETVERSCDSDIYNRIISAIYDTYPRATPSFCLINGRESSIERVQHRPDVRVATCFDRGDWHEGIEGHYAGCKTGWREALEQLHVVLRSPDTTSAD